MTLGETLVRQDRVGMPSNSGVPDARITHGAELRPVGRQEDR